MVRIESIDFWSPFAIARRPSRRRTSSRGDGASRRHVSFRSLSAAALLATFGAALSPGLAPAQRELTDIPDPSPQKELETFRIGEGLATNLFVADPDIAKPIHMNFDGQGRLWIASSEVYPQIRPGEPATDKILVCEDTDGDGAVDRTTVFADGLLVPTGILPGDGGCYVVNSTELLHLSDTDGDGAADTRRVVLSGFGTEDTHHLLHSLRWGPDGCIYMNQSIYIHSHVETPRGVRRMNGGGIWRFRPETMELETFCLGFVNPWGHHFDRWGQSFATDGAYGEGINHVFPGSVWVTSPGATRIMHGLNPGSPKHCGLEIISGRHFPESWRGSMVTNDFRANRVCRFVVTDDRSTYASRQEAEIIRTDHVAFRPIDAKMGPDGALYIADWYNPIIQHGEVDFRDERRDHVHGRVWRVTYEGRETLAPPTIVGAEIDELLDLLTVPEDWVRLWAKLELKGRPAVDVMPKLRAWVAALDADSPEFEHRRLEALWACQNLRVVEPELLAAVARSASGEARAAAIRVAVDWRDELGATAETMFRAAVVDDHPRVRLEGVRALAGSGTAEAAVEATRLLARPMDEPLDFALWQTLRDLQSLWLPRLLAGELDFDGDIDRITFALKAVEAPGIVEPLLQLAGRADLATERRAGVLVLAAGQASAEELDRIIAATERLGVAPVERMKLLERIAEATADRRVGPASGCPSAIDGIASDDPAARRSAIRIATIWRLTAAIEPLAELARSTDDDATFSAAIAALGRIDTDASRAAFLGLAQAARSPSRIARMLGERSRFDAVGSVAPIVEFLGEPRSEAEVVEAIGPLLGRQDGAAAMLSGLAGRTIDADAARLAIRAARSAPRPDETLIEALRAAGSLADAGWKRTPELVAELVTEVAASGDPVRGEAIYRRAELQCVNCHAIAGAGAVVGPDLLSIGASAPVDYLIDSLLEPNDKVKEGYHSKVIETDSGGLYTGIVVTVADGLWTLRQADGKLVRVLDEEIVDSADGRSLMPDGTVDGLTRQELVDLVAFLSRLGKVGEFSVDGRSLIRSWETLVRTDEAHRLLNRTSHDSAATDDPSLVWRSIASRVGGVLPTVELSFFSVHPGIPPTGFVRFDVQVTSAGLAEISFGESDGLALWVDGVPTSLSGTWRGELSEGKHRFVVAIDSTVRPEGITAELLPVDGGATLRPILASGE